MIRVVLVGACGRMGGEVARLLVGEKDMKLIAGVEAAGHPLLGTPLGSGMVVADLGSVLPDADVVVDFSLAAAVVSHALIAAEAGKPFITGVTGLSDSQMTKLRECAQHIPVLYAANFSVGVAVLARLISEAATLLGKEYDVAVVEIHHRRKKDAPSGTAKMLVETIRSKAGDRPVSISSVRTGDVVGEHTVIFGGPGERLELVHHAESRTAFASGVIAGIRFIQGRKPGFYSMEDVLGLSGKA